MDEFLKRLLVVQRNTVLNKRIQDALEMIDKFTLKKEDGYMTSEEWRKNLKNVLKPTKTNENDS